MQLTTTVNGVSDVRELTDGVYTIGRSSSCAIRLDDPYVSERHAVLTVRDGRAILEDLQSANGTLVNGVEIVRAVTLRESSSVEIGPCILKISIPRPDNAVPRPGDALAAPLTAIPPPPPASRLGISPGEAAAKRSTEGCAITAAPPLVAADPAAPRHCQASSLSALVQDDTVTEIMINGRDQTYVERNGKLQRVSCQFSDDAELLALIDRILKPLGRNIDPERPYVDARLPDGSRVNVIMPPLAINGPILTIRKFARNLLTVSDLVQCGTCSAFAADFLKLCIRMRKNIVVAGGTGSGKTTLLNIMSRFIPESERIVTIEDAAELHLQQPHVVRLESRPPDAEGKGGVTIRELVRNSLRMRPDRIIVGECRGEEALDMLQAMNTGHDGSLTTVHANSAQDVISRLETMVLMSGYQLPSRAIRDQISRAIDMVVQIERMSDGTRKIMAISEVMGMQGDEVSIQDIFAFRQEGTDDDGHIVGHCIATGAVPTWIEQVRNRGLTFDMKLFHS